MVVRSMCVQRGNMWRPEQLEKPWIRGFETAQTPKSPFALDVGQLPTY